MDRRECFAGKMDIRQLECFVRVAELGSFTRASIAMNVAQPALSRQVRLLEVELQQNLLERTGRGVKLTEAGKLLLEHGRGILHQVAVAREELTAARGALAGRVSIGLVPSLSRLITVSLTRAFQQYLPHAHLTLTEGFSAQMYEGLRVGDLDMAVLYNTNRLPDLDTTTLHQDELVLISAQEGQATNSGPFMTNSLALSEVARLPLILPSRRNVFRIVIDGELAKLGLKPRIALEVDALNAILNLVKEGLGHAVLPAYTLNKFNDTARLTVRSIQSPGIRIELSLVSSSRRPSTKTHRRALELIQQIVDQSIGCYAVGSPPMR
jgi:LysR family nitrogen assimilation transcriptional regulator